MALKNGWISKTKMYNDRHFVIIRLFRNLITLPTDVSKNYNLLKCCLHTFKHSKRYNRAKTKTYHLPGYGPLSVPHPYSPLALSGHTGLWRLSQSLRAMLLPAYLVIEKQVNETVKSHSSIVMAKATVTPLKPESLPVIELLVCVLRARLSQFITEGF